MESEAFFIAQVMNRSTGEYESVVAPPGGVVVNIGDVMQFWTSDKLVANVSDGSYSEMSVYGV